MNERERLMDEIAALALGVLPAEEAQRLRRQIALDEELFAEYEAYRGVADLVGFAAEPDAAKLDELSGARMKSKIMRAVRAQSAQTDGLRRNPLGWLPWGIAAAAIAAAFIAALQGFSLRQSVDAQRQQIAALQRNVATLQTQNTAQATVVASEHAQLADLLSASAKHYPVKGGDVVASNGHVYIAMHSLPPLAPGKVFQVWTLARGAKAVAPSITFTPNQNGTALVQVPPISAPLAAVAISIEPAGGSKAPTSTPTFIRPLS
jgi:anti-sigma-K factor RskA